MGTITWNEFGIGALFLALPQVPLTLSNAILAITEENNRLFPERKVVGIDCSPLIHGQGAIHCVTQQQPAP